MSELNPTKVLTTEKIPFTNDTTTTEPIVVIVPEIIPPAELEQGEEYIEEAVYVVTRKRVNIVRPAVITVAFAVINLIVPVLLLSGYDNFIFASIFAWAMTNIGYGLFIWLFVALVRRGFHAVMDSSTVDKIVKTTGKVAKGLKP